MQLQRPPLRTVAATDATSVVAATAAPLVPSDRTAAVVAICAIGVGAATAAFRLEDAGETGLRRPVR
jgi:hypothetical protein